MGTTKTQAVHNARHIAREYQEAVLVIHDQDYHDNYGEDCAYYTARDSFAGDWLNDPEITVIAVIEPA